jgi:hypothetical protein
MSSCTQKMMLTVEKLSLDMLDAAQRGLHSRGYKFIRIVNGILIGSRSEGIPVDEYFDAERERRRKLKEAFDIAAHSCNDDT